MCTFRASGRDFDVDSFVRATSLKPAKVYRRGEPVLPHSQPEGRKLEASGLAVAVSDGSWSSLTDQVEDALAFLTAHEAELRRLVETDGVEDARLDFPINARLGGRVAVQCDYLPPALLARAGVLGVGIEISTYPAHHDRDHDHEGADVGGG